MALWVAFNALYSSRSNYRLPDWKQIDEFAEADKSKTRHRDLLQSSVEYREAVDCPREYWFQRITDENERSQVLSTVRKVRNNLFHGRKFPGNLEDESLVTASYVIISKLMLIETFLNEKNAPI